MDGAKFFHSDKINQDPLEEHFGHIRMRGGGSENPTQEMFGLMNRKIVVISRICFKFSVEILVDEREMKLTSIFVTRVSCPSERENHEKYQCLKGKLKVASLTPPASVFI